jgi:hypothetical protein
VLGSIVLPAMTAAAMALTLKKLLLFIILP